MAQHVVAPHALALDEAHGHRAVVDGGAQAIDARDGRDDDHVPPLEERAGRRVAELVDLLVPRRVLLDVCVAARDVRLGLVVVVVGDEVLDGIVREELLELAVELRRERLVVGQDEGRPAAGGDDLGHRHGLARSGDALERLPLVPAREAGGKLGRGFRLIPGERPGQDELVRRRPGGPVEWDLKDLAGAAHDVVFQPF